MRSRLRYVLLCAVTGVFLVGIGAYLVIPSTSYRIPDLADAQIYQPTVEAFTDAPAVPLMIVADFKNSTDYRLRVMPVRFEDYTGRKVALDQIKPTRFWIQLKSGLSDFSWRGLVNVEEIAVTDPQGASPTSHLTHATSGTGKWAGFRGVLDAAHPYADIHFTPSRSPYVRQGPYMRVALPMIDTDYPDTDLLAAVADQLPSRDALRTSKLDGENLYPPALGLSVVTSPWDELNSSLVAQRVYPDPTRTSPLAWEVQDRFFPDLLYRDTEWDGQAATNIFIGGVCVGAGTGALLMPVALLQPVVPPQEDSQDNDSGSKTKGRRRSRKKASARQG